VTTDELEWDLTVDVICVGAGAGGLAAAIVAVDEGATAFVGHYRRPAEHARSGGAVNGLADALGAEVAERELDAETNAYLTALTEDLEPPAEAFDGSVPVLAASAPIPVEKPGRRDKVPPFFGGRLGDWAALCAASPFGVVYSRALTDAKSAQRKRRGAVVEYAELGSVDLDPDAHGLCLDEWMADAARARGIDVNEHSRLQRLIFEDGLVVGAVFDTPTATLAVRARDGVMLASEAGSAAEGATPLAALVAQRSTAEVCIVREPLSRFSRIELHVCESSVRPCVSARG
jgi:hypothetical protein